MLPPGSRGLPLLGETLEFFAASPTLELVPFFKRRLERYIYIFSTTIYMSIIIYIVFIKGTYTTLCAPF